MVYVELQDRLTPDDYLEFVSGPHAKYVGLDDVKILPIGEIHLRKFRKRPRTDAINGQFYSNMDWRNRLQGREEEIAKDISQKLNWPNSITLPTQSRYNRKGFRSDRRQYESRFPNDAPANSFTLHLFDETGNHIGGAIIFDGIVSADIGNIYGNSRRYTPDTLERLQEDIRIARNIVQAGINVTTKYMPEFLIEQLMGSSTQITIHPHSSQAKQSIEVIISSS